MAQVHLAEDTIKNGTETVLGVIDTASFLAKEGLDASSISSQTSPLTRSGSWRCSVCHVPGPDGIGV